MATVEVRPEVYDAFARETDRRLGASVWNRGGCASWYMDCERAQRDLVAGLHGELWRRTRRFDRGSYRAEPA